MYFAMYFYSNRRDQCVDKHREEYLWRYDERNERVARVSISSQGIAGFVCF
jgi:hypothetical protein